MDQNPNIPVSVIIPVYNTGMILRETVASVLAQTMPDFELLLIDDGSNEETQRLLDTFTDRRLRVIRQQNLGVAAARNRGIAEARGKYLAFLDHDDQWLPEKLQVQYDLLERAPTAAFCYSPVRYFGDDSTVPRIDFAAVSGRCGPSLLRQNKIASTSCVMFRRDILERCGGFDPQCVPCDDWDLYLQAAPLGEVLVTDCALVRYRCHAGNTGGDRERMYLAGLRVLEKHRDRLPGLCTSDVPLRTVKRYWNFNYARHCYGLAWHSAGRHEIGEALRWSLRTLRSDWTCWRLYWLWVRIPIREMRRILSPKRDRNPSAGGKTPQKN